MSDVDLCVPESPKLRKNWNTSIVRHTRISRKLVLGFKDVGLNSREKELLKPMQNDLKRLGGKWVEIYIHIYIYIYYTYNDIQLYNINILNHTAW